MFFYNFFKLFFLALFIPSLSTFLVILLFNLIGIFDNTWSGGKQILISCFYSFLCSAFSGVFLLEKKGETNGFMNGYFKGPSEYVDDIMSRILGKIMNNTNYSQSVYDACHLLGAATIFFLLPFVVLEILIYKLYKKAHSLKRKIWA